MDILLTPYSGWLLGPIAKLIGYLMNFIYMGMSAIGVQNVGISILLLTIVIYLLMLPLTYQQQKFSKLSQKMQPEIKAVQDKYKNKKDQASMQAMNAETQLIYQKYGVSTMGSCLQLVIQMPILLALYRVFNNVPAYITSVKDQFSDLVNGIVATDGSGDTLTAIVEQFKLSSIKADFTTTGTTLKNYIVDVLYKLPSTAWGDIPSGASSDEAAKYLVNYFPDLSSSITSTAHSIDNFNYFLGLNISDSPLNIIKTSFANGTYWLALIAVAFPIFSYLTQRLNIKLTPQSNSNDQAAQTMKTMNIAMPLMSFIFCFSLPVGLGIYWIAGALVRSVQQVIFNKHFDKMDLDDIIEKNKEKVAKKKEKLDQYQGQIAAAAQIKTKSIDAKANIKVSNDSGEADEIDMSQVDDLKKNARPGSLASKANMVREFNEKNSRK